MVELNFFIFQITKFYKLVNYLENWLVFQIRNFWYFKNWKFLDGVQNIQWSHVERPRFRNFKTKNIKKKRKMSYSIFLFTYLFFPYL